MCLTKLFQENCYVPLKFRQWSNLFVNMYGHTIRSVKSQPVSLYKLTSKGLEIRTLSYVFEQALQQGRSANHPCIQCNPWSKKLSAQHLNCYPDTNSGTSSLTMGRS